MGRNLFLNVSSFSGANFIIKITTIIYDSFKFNNSSFIWGVFAQFAIKSPKTGIFALVVSFIMTKVVALIPGNPSFIVTLVSVFSTIAFAKKVMDKQK